MMKDRCIIEHGPYRIECAIEPLALEAARALFDHRAENRLLSARKIEQYRRDLVDGRWRFNGETIIVDDTGRLLDGQHRVRALIEAFEGGELTAPPPLLVVRGINPVLAWPTIDTGLKRTMAHTLQAHGEKDTLALAGALVWLWRLRTENLTSEKCHLQPTTMQAEELLVKEPGLRDAIPVGHRMRSLIMGRSVGTFLYYVWAQSDQAKANELIGMLLGDVDLKAGSPAQKLQSYLLGVRAANRKPRQIDYIATVIKGWNAHKRGLPLKQLAFRSSHEGFPVIA